MLGRRICHSPLLASCLLLAQWKEQGVFQQKFPNAFVDLDEA